MKSFYHIVTIVALSGAAAGQVLPTVTVTEDNTRLTKSCRVVIPEGTIIADADGNGVIHVAADGITVEFADGSALRGAAPGTPWNTLGGYGIRIQGHSGVTLANVRVHGFKGGIYATRADGLTVADSDLSDNYRARLNSTPEAEDSGDWLSPHNNDDNEWLTNYGAALYIEESSDVTVRDLYIRRGQNGIVLDEVDHSRIYDNDASFLSGWGCAMWRSSDNVISRNAFDFCVRGHVEGVYNRGQDSAGLLMFEQCSRNVVAENSLTHGGDGFFGFGGLEALGQHESDDPDFTAKRAGCNDNLFVRNDLSYAPAHGLEMTFSFGNVMIDNRVVENAICGVWGGFSQDFLIAGNHFDGNGGMPYGLERGAINIEHGAGNVVVGNEFVNNRAAIHYWWDDPGNIDDLPWGQENYRKVDANVIAGNRFVVDSEPRPFHNWGQHEKRVVYHLRDDGQGNITNTVVTGNEYELSGSVARRLDKPESVEITETGDVPGWETPSYVAYGDNRPVGARAHLRGRDKIVMTEWGPWDHASPIIRSVTMGGDRHVYELIGFGDDPEVSLDADKAALATEATETGSILATVSGKEGVHPYTLRVSDGTDVALASGSLVNIRWLGRVFSWKDKVDPREDFDAWADLARFQGSLPFRADSVDFKYGWGGPKDMVRAGVFEDTTRSGTSIETSDIEADRFGVELLGRTRLGPGRYEVRTVSDDGIRVWVEGELVIDNWTHHGPTEDVGHFELDRTEMVQIRVLHFEIDGYAMLTFSLGAAK